MRKLFQTLFSKKGQSIIEYALLIILVLAGVYVMSPYVIRSWNANIKGWEDSVTDSFQDPIGASPPGIIDVTGTCRYQDPCSNPPCCGYGTCEEYEATTAWICNPIGYQSPPGGVAYNCTEVAACCTTPVQLPVPANCGTLGCLSTEVPALYSCGGDPDHNNPTRVECQYNRNCDLVCQGAPPNPGDVEYAPAVCPSDNINLPFPPPSYVFVEEGKCSAPVGSNPKCQWECATSFVPGFGATSCECPAGSINILGVCVIDCTLSAGDCTVRVPPPFPPDPTGCNVLTFDECEPIYGSACQWNPFAGCQEHTPCTNFLTNVSLLYPTPAIDNRFARCDFFPWCEWVGGGGYCCMAVQQNGCNLPVFAADSTGCGANEVLACCQFDTAGSCNPNGVGCTLPTDCCSNNCVGAGALGGPFCCLPSQTGVCVGGANNGDCCAGAINCPGGACVP